MKRALCLLLIGCARDLALSGVYQSPGPTQLTSVKWTLKTDDPIIGSPTVANGVVFFGGTDGSLHAVDEETGQQKWKYRTLASRQVTSSPAIATGVAS